MAKLQAVNFNEFTLKKAAISDAGVTAEYEEKRVIDNENVVIEHSIKTNYIPHPDLTRLRDKMREYLVKSFHLNEGFDLAIKYLKGEQKKIAEEAMIDLFQKVEVTGISISGSDQLRGVVISGKIESNNKSKCALNTPRIVFSSEKIGYESDVEALTELIEKEVYKYIFEGKKAQQDLFDQENQEEARSQKKEEAGALA